MASMESALVLFDIDGTLIDAGGAGRRAMERAFAAVFGLDDLGDTGSVRFAGMTDHEILDGLGTVSGVDIDRVDRERDRLVEAYLVELADEMRRPGTRLREIPGASALLRRLEERGNVLLGLVTGNLEAGARTKLAPFGLNRFFPTGGFGSDHRDRAVLARLARKKIETARGIEVETSSVTLVGDTERDVASAKANGFRAVAIDSGWAPRAALQAEGADAVFDDLTDLPGLLSAFGLV
jgi:phosphoglycolate phosphatase-like HAD superfamily hydrolase